MKPVYMRKTKYTWTPMTKTLAHWLRFDEGWTYEEIGKYFECSASAVQATVLNSRSNGRLR